MLIQLDPSWYIFVRDLHQRHLLHLFQMVFQHFLFDHIVLLNQSYLLNLVTVLHYYLDMNLLSLRRLIDQQTIMFHFRWFVRLDRLIHQKVMYMLRLMKLYLVL